MQTGPARGAQSEVHAPLGGVDQGRTILRPAQSVPVVQGVQDRLSQRNVAEQDRVLGVVEEAVVQNPCRLARKTA